MTNEIILHLLLKVVVSLTEMFLAQILIAIVFLGKKILTQAYYYDNLSVNISKRFISEIKTLS